MALTIQMRRVGGPEVLVATDSEIPDPGPGEVRIRQSTIGVSFVDLYHRTGLYALPELPAVLGVEGAGVVDAVGERVVDLHAGDRVAYAGTPPGGYAEVRNIPRARLVRLPDDIPERVGGSTMLRGLTVHMLLRKVHPISEGDFVLVHAAAGGLGQMLTRWAKRLGAVVIGTVGSERKVDTAREAGADAVLLRDVSDWPTTVRELADGKGVHLAVDGIGGEHFARTLATVRPFGTVASVGQAGGPIPQLHVEELGPKRSASLSRPSLIAYANDPALYRPAAEELFAVLREGLVNPIGAEYPLREASRAHADLEAGRTTGSVILYT
ncbi:MAG TPA: quinone oxidoreductase [Gemmatimonadaceae bacterium]|nr:quinone oxidoreductase [Gemmatimonadaceae bacterium]